MGKRLVFFMTVFLLFAVIASGCTSAEEQGESSVSPTSEAAADASSNVTLPLPSDEDEEFIDGICPQTIMVEGVLYEDFTYYTDVLDITVDDSQILGRITSVVNITQLPAQDGEANYEVLDAPYARWSDEDHPDAIVLYYGYGWHLLIPAGTLVD